MIREPGTVAGTFLLSAVLCLLIAVCPSQCSSARNNNVYVANVIRKTSAADGSVILTVRRVRQLPVASANDFYRKYGVGRRNNDGDGVGGKSDQNVLRLRDEVKEAGKIRVKKLKRRRSKAKSGTRRRKKGENQI